MTRDKRHTKIIVILANVPVWTLPGLEYLNHNRHYATWLEPLIPAFADRQELQIHWVTMCKETKKSLVHLAHGQTFHILSRGSLAFQMVTGYVTETLRIRTAIKKIKPDIVHVWGSEEGYAIAGALSGINLRLFTLQGCLTEYLRVIGGNFLFRIQTLYEKPVVNHYHYATAESPAAAKQLSQLNPRIRLRLVDYGVDQAFYNATWNPSSFPVVLFIGGLNKRKGIRDLVSIASHPELQNIHFKIIGDGNLREELEREATPNVTWLGKCDRSTVIKELESAWALVMPTYSDTGPTVIKEARVIGLPVITTHAAGACCYIEEGMSGFIGNPGDLKFLKASLISLSESRDKAVKMGQHNHKNIRELLQPKVTIEKFVKIYEEMLQNS